MHSITYESVMYAIWISDLQSDILYNYYVKQTNKQTKYIHMKHGTAEDSELTILAFMPICLGLSVFLLLQRL